MMKKVPFYIITNALYMMSIKRYVHHIKSSVLDQAWFKDACKQKKVSIKYLSKNFLDDISMNCYANIVNSGLFYAHKLLLVRFEYMPLECNNHIKLLNINLKNESVFNVMQLLFASQKLYLQTFRYQDLKLIKRSEIINIYKATFELYMDNSVLSKILQNNFLHVSGKKISFAELVPKESYIYSLYIKDIINSAPSALSDLAISEILYKQYNVVFTRRKICYIRNRYLIQSVSRCINTYFYINNEKLYGIKRELSKVNIINFCNENKGVYELSVKHDETYPQSKLEIVYIGSSKNLKKRLLLYASNHAHTVRIKTFLLEHTIYFRIINTNNYKEYEMLFLNGFVSLYGALPVLNKQIIKMKRYI